MKTRISRAESTTKKIGDDFPSWTDNDPTSIFELTPEQQKFLGVKTSRVSNTDLVKLMSKFIVDDHSYANICRIMEDIANKKLTLQIEGDRSFTDGKTITVPEELTFSSKSISDEKLHYTLLEHELAHIIFESDMRNFDAFNKWFYEYSQEYVKDYVKKNNLDDKFIDLFNGVEWESILHAVLNIVEDHRIEHNWGKIYPGSRYRFNDVTKGLADQVSIEELEQMVQSEHLSNTLLISRIFKNEIINKNTKSKVLDTNKDLRFCAEQLGAVENKSAITTLIESKNIVKQWMPKFMKQLKNLKEQKEPTPTPLDGECTNSIKGNCPTNSHIKSKKLSKKQEIALIEDSKGGKEYLEKAGEKTQKRIEEKIKEIIEPEYYEGAKTGSVKVIGKIVEQDVFNSWRAGDNRKIDEHDVQKLRRFFATVRAKNKIDLDEEGDSIDPEAFIQFKANPNMNEIFINEDISQGLDISLLIDISGSMSYSQRLDMATKYAKTLHRALASLDNVKLRTWAFSGNRRNERLTPVVEIPYDRLDNIQPEQHNIFTHTWNGIAHVANKMRGSTGKKLMIVLTDGMPEAGTDKINKIQATKEAVEYSFLTGTKVYVIKVGGYDTEMMKNIFGPQTNWTEVSNMEDAERHLWSQVIKAVYRTLIQ